MALWGSGPAFGMDANMLLAWHEYGGARPADGNPEGRGVNAVSLMAARPPTQPLRLVQAAGNQDRMLGGAKFRTVGLAIDVHGHGSGGERLAGRRKSCPPWIAACWMAPNSTRRRTALGFQDVSKICMLQSFHQRGAVRNHVQQGCTSAAATPEARVELCGGGQQRTCVAGAPNPLFAGRNTTRQVLQDA